LSDHEHFVFGGVLSLPAVYLTRVKGEEAEHLMEQSWFSTSTKIRDVARRPNSTSDIHHGIVYCM
jgi:hypothetical protein